MPDVFARYPPGVEGLFQEVCKHRGRDSVYVSTFPRFGFSGAKLFLVCFSTPKARPLLLKVALNHKAKDEFEAVESMRDFVSDCRLEERCIFNSGEWGGLLYPHLGTDDLEEAEKPSALRERLFSAEDKFPKAQLASVVEGVYLRMANAHSAFEWRVCDIESAYGDYFRSEKSVARIKKILGYRAKETRCEFLGSSIYNPIAFRKTIPNRGTLPLGRVHGDLHPDNIILDQDGRPHLIDFAWAKHPRDILVDFVLMENSIRFRDFPRAANLEEQLQVDAAFLEEDFVDRIATIPFAHSETGRVHERLALTISAIRTRAKKLLDGRFTMEAYLFAQFVVLYGLLRYEQYEPYTSVRALGLIADRLDSTGWRFLDTQ